MIDPKPWIEKNEIPQRHDKDVGTDYGHGNVEDRSYRYIANLIDKECLTKKKLKNLVANRYQFNFTMSYFLKRKCSVI